MRKTKQLPRRTRKMVRKSVEISKNNLIQFCFRSTWQNIILGQFLSLMLCTLTILTHYMNKGVSGSMPTGQSFPHYMLLCVVYTTWLACRGGNNGLITILKSRGLRYFLLCLIDVEANFLSSLAHQFTSITSIQVRKHFYF